MTRPELFKTTVGTVTSHKMSEEQLELPNPNFRVVKFNDINGITRVKKKMSSGEQSPAINTATVVSSKNSKKPFGNYSTAGTVDSN